MLIRLKHELVLMRKVQESLAINVSPTKSIAVNVAFNRDDDDADGTYYARRVLNYHGESLGSMLDVPVEMWVTTFDSTFNSPVWLECDLSGDHNVTTMLDHGIAWHPVSRKLAELKTGVPSSHTLRLHSILQDIISGQSSGIDIARLI